MIKYITLSELLINPFQFENSRIVVHRQIDIFSIIEKIKNLHKCIQEHKQTIKQENKMINFIASTGNFKNVSLDENLILVDSELFLPYVAQQIIEKYDQ